MTKHATPHGRAGGRVAGRHRWLDFGRLLGPQGVQFRGSLRARTIGSPGAVSELANKPYGGCDGKGLWAAVALRKPGGMELRRHRGVIVVC